MAGTTIRSWLDVVDFNAKKSAAAEDFATINSDSLCDLRQFFMAKSVINLSSENTEISGQLTH